LLGAERNVKRVHGWSRIELVPLDGKPNFSPLGKKFGKRRPGAAQAVAAFGTGQLRGGMPENRTVGYNVCETEAGFAVSDRISEGRGSAEKGSPLISTESRPQWPSQG
jgi:hypothetical protein